MPVSLEFEFRVRYHETDAQGRVHHANFFKYFEQGRVELLRSLGYDYRRVEDGGLMLVVADIQCKYFLPASFDDLVRLKTSVVKVGGVRIHHEYELYRADELLAKGVSTVACVDKLGKVRPLPTWLRELLV